MKTTNAYPYAPLKTRTIPLRLSSAALKHGMALAEGKESWGAPMFDLELRLMTDLWTAEHGTVWTPGVTR